MTKLIWNRPSKIYGWHDYDGLPPVGSFADRVRNAKLVGQEINLDEDAHPNQDEAKKLKNRLKYRALLWETVKNLSEINRSFRLKIAYQGEIAEYGQYLAMFLNLAKRLAIEYSGAVKKGDDFYIYEESSIKEALHLTGVKKITRTTNVGEKIDSGYFYFW